jgi:Spy/CpxP family protein refolding chaperone
MMKRTYRNVLAASTAALAIALAATLASAQPGPHGGHMGGPMGGPMGDHLGQVIESAKAQLNLNTSQQQTFVDAVALAKANFAAGRTEWQAVKNVLTDELAKDEPNLAAVAAAADKAQQDGLALRHQVRDAWLGLYATFTKEQKAVVKGMIQQHMAKMESFRQRMVERFSTGS